LAFAAAEPIPKIFSGKSGNKWQALLPKFPLGALETRRFPNI
jgi:hypothetical protein